MMVHSSRFAELLAYLDFIIPLELTLFIVLNNQITKP